MDYDCDTLTSAKNNRAASQRFYNQVMPSRVLQSQEIPVMLHRSPSGAKRRIRQREQGVRPSPFTSPSSSSAVSPSPDQSMNRSMDQSINRSADRSMDRSITDEYEYKEDNYRSLIDSGGYKSILPDMPTVYPSPRLAQSSVFSCSMSSLDVTHSSSPSTDSTAASTVSADTYLPQTTQQQHTKPTVEVHPMPSEERNSVRGDMKREKPAVPAKPKGLILDHMNRSTSLTSLCSSPITQTTSTFLNNLVNSSSFISLQQAYGQEMGSQEFQKLEEKRNESISAVSQRLSSFECSRGELEDVLRGHQRTGEQIMAIVEQADHQLAAKVRNQMHNSDELLRLETKLHHQMEKLNEHLRLGGVQQDQAKLEESRLRRRVGDVALLKQTYMRRERALEQQMGVMLSPEQQQQWRMHRELAAQLIKNTKQVDDQIEDSRVHLKALQNTKPFAT